jgi:hypothetical protein
LQTNNSEKLFAIRTTTASDFIILSFFVRFHFVSSEAQEIISTTFAIKHKLDYEIFINSHAELSL